MELKDILGQQSAWLDRLRNGMPETATDGATTDLIDTQAKAIEERIANLIQQKALVVQQFNSAIARHTDTLTALKATTPANLTNNVLQGSGKNLV